MKDMAVIGLVVALLIVPAWGQSKPASDTQSIGTITGTDVYVRSGPSATAYPCAKVHKPGTVTIVGKTGEWLEILPPAGTFSVIKKEFLTKETDGSGTATADAVYVRPGGELRTNDFWGIHGKLNKGDKVKILGEIGDFYKIESPSGAHFYVSSRYVSTDGTAAVAAVTPTSSPTEGTLGGATVQVIHSSTTQTVTKVKPTYFAELEAFRAVDKELTDEWAKPHEQRDYKGLLAKFQALNITEPNLKPFQEHRIKQLETILDRNMAGTTAGNIIDKIMHDDAIIKDQIRQIVVDRTRADIGPIRYDAQGILGESNLFVGGATGKLYVVRDPITKRVDAYLQSANDTVGLASYMGKHIGVMGKAQYDKTMMLNIISVDKVIPLESNTDIPAVDKPTVRETVPPPPAEKLPPMPPAKTDEMKAEGVSTGTDMDMSSGPAAETPAATPTTTSAPATTTAPAVDPNKTTKKPMSESTI